MNGIKSDHYVNSPMVMGVVNKIVELLGPQRIYLYNQRINSRNLISSFKLCIVTEVGDKFAAERDIYMEIDCDVPFDILIYTPAEWEDLIDSETSFARKILDSGLVLYNG
ncbi:hypothetical protein LJC63_05665 [Ruminococcaceae bacterium OttesenSCG-928-L11]|nr:hypothetical protein [Ruminococcaceae bacterium OttesenSCG-928-L11]